MEFSRSLTTRKTHPRSAKHATQRRTHPGTAHPCAAPAPASWPSEAAATVVQGRDRKSAACSPAAEPAPRHSPLRHYMHRGAGFATARAVETRKDVYLVNALRVE